MLLLAAFPGFPLQSGGHAAEYDDPSNDLTGDFAGASSGYRQAANSPGPRSLAG